MRASVLLTVGSMLLVAGNARAAENAGANKFPSDSVIDGVGVNAFSSDFDDPSFAERLRAAGARVVRVDFDPGMPDSLDKTFGFNFAVHDGIVRQCAENGLRVHAILITSVKHVGPPTWLEMICGETSFSTCLASSYFRGNFNEFVFYAVSRYPSGFLMDSAGELNPDPYWNPHFTWELWNEPNHDFWPGSNPDDYMKLAMGVPEDVCNVGLCNPPIEDGQFYKKGALQIIRDYGDPLSTIIAPAVAPNVGEPWKEYLKTCFQRYLLTRVDGVSAHFYRDFDGKPEIVTNEYEPTDSGSLRALINYSGGNTIPIISGECGYSVGAGRIITEQVQADYLQRMMLTNFSSESIPLSIWYNAKDHPEDEDHHFGLFDSHGNARPSFYAMKTLTQSLTWWTRNAKFHKAVNHIDDLDDTDANHLKDYPNSHWLVFKAPWDILVGWNDDDTISVNTAKGWGTYLLTGTPLYVAAPLVWEGGYSGTWPGTHWKVDTFQWGWVSGFQAQFDEPQASYQVPVLVDVGAEGGEYTISGLQFNNWVRLKGGTLRFTPGGGNVYVADGRFAWINSVLADAYDRGTEPLLTTNPNLPASLAHTNTPETFALRKSGSGELVLGGNNTFHGRVLVGEGYVKTESDHALGDPSNPVTLAGGGIDLNGHNLTTGPLTVVGDSRLVNYGDASSTYAPESFNVNNGNLSIAGGPDITISSVINVLGGNGPFGSRGTITLEGSELNVNGWIGLVGGKLAGTGTVSGTVIAVGYGSISPGSGGTLQIEGYVWLDNSSSLEIEIGRSVLQVTGSVDLTSGPLLDILGDVPCGGKYAIISATEINGSFSNISAISIEREGATQTMYYYPGDC